jgi:hypothetical protein
MGQISFHSSLKVLFFNTIFIFMLGEEKTHVHKRIFSAIENDECNHFYMKCVPNGTGIYCPLAAQMYN